MPYKDPEKKKQWRQLHQKEWYHKTRNTPKGKARYKRQYEKQQAHLKANPRTPEQKELRRQREADWKENRMSRKTALKKGWTTHLKNSENESKKSNRRQNLIEFDEWATLVQDKCFYCDVLPPKPSKINGIDRLDNQKGYFMGNIITACWPCNKIKSRYSVEEFVTVCLSVSFNLLNKAEVDGTMFKVRFPNGKNLCWDMKS